MPTANVSLSWTYLSLSQRSIVVSLARERTSAEANTTRGSVGLWTLVVVECSDDKGEEKAKVSEAAAASSSSSRVSRLRDRNQLH